MRIASFSNTARRRTAIAAACLGAATIAVPGVAWAQNPIGSSSPTAIGPPAHARVIDGAEGCQFWEKELSPGDGTVMKIDRDDVVVAEYEDWAVTEHYGTYPEIGEAGTVLPYTALPSDPGTPYTIISSDSEIPYTLVPC
ncbi:hypothetical protein [Rhodococcus marinonascens]|uniref:hypothetical protein n=1 Tax=Rhodococcus marinonascens TaxID=38311 RepID=UPI00093333FB|nr:hypothetical protein [Rhodococcus marinonascens]